jgi:hypothetical protein
MNTNKITLCVAYVFICSTYYETDACEEGDYNLVFNMDTYMILIPSEQFSRISPLKEGWHGHLYILSVHCIIAN